MSERSGFHNKLEIERKVDRRQPGCTTTRRAGGSASAEGCEREVRPLLIFTNGYDGTITDMQPGFWAHGVDNLRDYLGVELFTMEDVPSEFNVPRCSRWRTTLWAQPAPTFLDALRCPKTLLRFTAAEGASGHCEMV